MFNYYLDNNLVNNPENWKDFTEVLEYDIENNTYLYSYPTEIKWNGGDAYHYLVPLFDTNNSGYSELRIEQEICGTYKNVFIGNVFYSDMKINRLKCTLEAKVVDNNFKSFLNNNKNIDVRIQEDNSTSKTKNGVSMLNQINIAEVSFQLFNPATGAYTTATSPTGFYLEDCFKYLVAFLSDLQIDFRSNYLDRTQSIVNDIDNVKRIVVLTGGNLWAGNRDNNFFYGLNPKISLYRLLKEVNRFYRIGYYIDYDFNNTPTFVVESLDFFRSNTTILSYTDVNDVTEERFLEAFYSSVKVGGEYDDYEDDTTNLKFEDAENYGYQEEDYYFSNQDNVDKELDLTGEVIVDTNIIQHLTYMSAGATDSYVEQYRDSLFFIEVELTTPETAYKTVNNAVNNSAYYHYNENLLNINIVERVDNLGDIYFSSPTNVYNLINNSPKQYLKSFKFTRYISDSDYQTFKTNILAKIQVNVDNNGNTASGWVKRFERKFYTGESQIELRGE